MRVVICYFHYGDDNYLALMKMAFESAKLYGCETVLVTGSDISVGQDATIKIGHSGEDVLMPAILEAQKAYIDSALFDSNSILFSPDALVARPPGPVFDKKFDMGVTIGTSIDYPINNGVIYIRPEMKDKLSLLWADFVHRCKSYNASMQMWYGDQKAMHEVLVECDDEPYGMKVKRLLPMPYNAAFSHNRPWCASDDLAFHTSYVLHFKGARKEKMAEFWGKVKKRHEICGN